MNRVVRAVVVWLLLVALPLQGYAAGSMLFCGSGVATPAAAQHHRDASSAFDGAHAAHSHGAAATAEASVSEPDAPNPHDAMHGKCSVCSSCCSTAALPSMPLAATPTTPDASPLPGLEHANPGHGLARLERPPRSHLA